MAPRASTCGATLDSPAPFAENVPMPAEIHSGPHDPFLLGVFYGIMVFFVVHNLFLWRSLRDRTYLSYAFLLAYVTVLFATLSGSTFELLTRLLEDPLPVFHTLLYVSQQLVMAQVLQFLRCALRTPGKRPRLDRNLRLLMGVDYVLMGLFLGLVLGLGEPGVAERISELVTPANGVLHTAVYVVTVILFTRAGHRPAGYYLAGGLLLLAGTWVEAARESLPFLPNLVKVYANYYGALAQILFSTFGLSRRLRLDQRGQERQRERLAQADKMVSLGTMASSVVHEIANPNGAVLANTTFLTGTYRYLFDALETCQGGAPARLAGLPYEVAREKTGQALTGIERSAGRVAAIVEQLRGFYRGTRRGARERVDVDQVVRSAVALLALYRSPVETVAEVAPGLPSLDVNRQDLEQALVNLLMNARHAVEERRVGDDRERPRRWGRVGHKRTAEAVAPGGPAVLVRAFLDADGGHVKISVTDTGIGMDAGTLKRIREPFFTTRAEQGGSGLGLYIVRTVTAEHGGSMEISSAPGRGTTVTLTLPSSALATGEARS